jgi:putative SOS response-associated peptidase YedK
VCGRYTITPSRQELEAGFAELKDLPQDRIFAERFNVAPTQEVVALTRPDPEGPRVAELLRWGLVPKWATAPDDGVKMINARSETIAEKPSYKGLVAKSKGRCLILADGFYEWEVVASGPKQPWRFSLAGGEVFALAGLCTTWTPEEGQPLRSCTVITTEPNELVAPVHDRMPAIITDEESMAAWLAPEVDSDAARALLAPLPATSMRKDKAAQAVGKPANEGPALLHPEQPGLF